MMTDERLAECAEHACYNSKCNYMVGDLIQEIKRLRSENSELRKRLAVYEKDIPSSYALNKCANIAHASMMFPGEYSNEAMKAVSYLRRISSANEVQK